MRGYVEDMEVMRFGILKEHLVRLEGTEVEHYLAVAREESGLVGDAKGKSIDERLFGAPILRR